MPTPGPSRSSPRKPSKTTSNVPTEKETNQAKPSSLRKAASTSNTTLPVKRLAAGRAESIKATTSSVERRTSRIATKNQASSSASPARKTETGTRISVSQKTEESAEDSDELIDVEKSPPRSRTKKVQLASVPKSTLDIVKEEKPSSSQIETSSKRRSLPFDRKDGGSVEGTNDIDSSPATSRAESPKRGRGRPRINDAEDKSSVSPFVSSTQRRTLISESSTAESIDESSTAGSPGPRQTSRRRLPSRKVIESRMIEKDIDASLGTSKSRPSKRSNIQRDSSSDEQVIVDGEVEFFEVKEEVKETYADVSTTHKEEIVEVDVNTISIQEEDQQKNDRSTKGLESQTTVQPIQHNRRPKQQTGMIAKKRKIAVDDGDVDVVSTQSPRPTKKAAPGEDLPDEHRPREKARHVFEVTRSIEIQQHEEAMYLRRKTAGQETSSSSVLVDNVPSPEGEEQIIEEVVLDNNQLIRIDPKIHGPNTYTVVNEHGEEIVYEIQDGEMIEEVEYDQVPEGMEIVEAQEVRNPDGSTTIIHSVARRIPERDGMGKVKKEAGHEEVDEDTPPQLLPEGGPDAPVTESDLQINNNTAELLEDNMIRVQTPNGTQQYVTLAQTDDGTEVYVDANGDIVQLVHDASVLSQGDDLRTVEFNFLDSKNICCGLCGEIVPYDNLMTDHIPNNHPDVVSSDGIPGVDEIPYQEWLREKLYNEKKVMENGFRQYGDTHGMPQRMHTLRSLNQARMLRKVSQVRVNPAEMNLPQLEAALRKKMIEKMGRKVSVTLVDKQHARCGICNAVVSINKKFEIVHLVRHFNAWHPAAHRCAGTWITRIPQVGGGKPLTTQDFAVIDVSLDSVENLQCIWCGMFMDRNALAMHFTEVHPEEIEVPKCLLCLQELVINARLAEKYGEDFEVTLPDEFHVKCHKFEQVFNSEKQLDRAIEKNVKKMQHQQTGVVEEDVGDEDDDDDDAVSSEKTNTNSRMTFGKRCKPKRSFVQPSLRQVDPVNSKYVEAVSECQWRCKLCNANIFGAVISAGAIKHYKNEHPAEMENMQYELCKLRLEKISDGCMEFVHPQLVECLICSLTYALHKPYNMCRGIRHLKAKHPETMPEFGGTAAALKRNEAKTSISNYRVGELIEDEEMIARFRSEYNVPFEKVQTLYSDVGEPVYVLLPHSEAMDVESAANLAISYMENGNNSTMDDIDDEDDPFGHMEEEDELANIEQGQAHPSADNDPTNEIDNTEGDEFVMLEEEQDDGIKREIQCVEEDGMYPVDANITGYSVEEQLPAAYDEDGNPVQVEYMTEEEFAAATAGEGNYIVEGDEHYMEEEREGEDDRQTEMIDEEEQQARQDEINRQNQGKK